MVEAIGSRPKYRKGFAKPLVGNQVHILLALADPEDPTEEGVGGGWDGAGGEQAGRGEGFDRDFLERSIEEIFHEVRGRGGSVHPRPRRPWPPEESPASRPVSPPYRRRAPIPRGRARERRTRPTWEWGFRGRRTDRIGRGSGPPAPLVPTL